MTVETDTDRATLLADFGEACTVHPGNVAYSLSSKAAAITLIFDADYAELVGFEARIDSNKPVAIGRTSDLDDVRRGSMIQRGADEYKVVDIQPDGTGMTLLEFEGPR